MPEGLSSSLTLHFSKSPIYDYRRLPHVNHSGRSRSRHHENHRSVNTVPIIPATTCRQHHPKLHQWERTVNFPFHNANFVKGHVLHAHLKVSNRTHRQLPSPFRPIETSLQANMQRPRVTASMVTSAVIGAMLESMTLIGRNTLNNKTRTSLGVLRYKALGGAIDSAWVRQATTIRQ